VKLRMIMIILFAGLFALAPIGSLFALDAPHNASEGIACGSCHVPHNSMGGNLTNQVVNPAICKSCHNIAGTAARWAFQDSDQATPGVSGRSHKWSGLMPGISNPSNQYGLRATANLANSAMKTRLSSSGNVVVCSVCHDEHSELKAPFDPFTVASRSGDAGTATGGSTTTIVDTSKAWTTNQWVNAFVKITDGPNPATNSNIGIEVRVVSNTANTLTVVSSGFPAAIQANDVYYLTSGRHFMRSTNSANEMCKDCHYYRVQTDVTVYTGEMLSHPVGLTMASAKNPARFFNLPLEPEWAGFAPQAGARGELNGGADVNLSNNLVLGLSGEIQCLTCHGVHYTDSDSWTLDMWW